MSNNKQSICIFLNSQSANSYVNNYTSECIFVLPTINIPKKSKVSISVQTASIPHSFYNCDDFNNKLVYIENNITYVKYIDQGNYNVLTLMTKLQTLMGTNFIINYSSLDNSYTFTNSLYEFQILSSSLCYEIIGLKSGTSYSSTNKILKSNISINLFTIRNIYISSNNLILNNVNSSTPNNSSILCSVPITSSAGSVISYSNIYDVRNEVYHTNNLNLLHIKLTDQDCDILDLNGCHFSLTLQLDIMK
jgi:hypothetical protein